MQGVCLAQVFLMDANLLPVCLRSVVPLNDDGGLVLERLNRGVDDKEPGCMSRPKAKVLVEAMIIEAKNCRLEDVGSGGCSTRAAPSIAFPLECSLWLHASETESSRWIRPEPGGRISAQATQRSRDLRLGEPVSCSVASLDVSWIPDERECSGAIAADWGAEQPEWTRETDRERASPCAQVGFIVWKETPEPVGQAGSSVRGRGHGQ